MSEEILGEIKKILYPRIGEVVANSSIRVNCQRMGIKEKELTKEKLNAFSEKIKVSLLLFLEDKDVEKIIKEINSI